MLSLMLVSGVVTGMRDTTHLAENVKADPDLTPEERESFIHWAGDVNQATVYTEERGVMPSLLRSPVATVQTIRVTNESQTGGTIPVEEYSGGHVTGVKATVPIGAVLIKSDPRMSNNRSQVVSDYDMGEA